MPMGSLKHTDAAVCVLLKHIKIEEDMFARLAIFHYVLMPVFWNFVESNIKGI